VRRPGRPFVPPAAFAARPEPVLSWVFSHPGSFCPNRTASQRGFLSWGSAPLQRIRQREATCTGFASPGYAAPSGFLSLLTHHSSRSPDGFVSHRRRSWGSALQRFPLPIRQRRLSTLLPLMVFLSARDVAVRRPSPLASPRPMHESCHEDRRRSPSRGFVERTHLQGCEPDRESVRPAGGVSRTAGAGPLVGFQPSRVFSLPAMARPLPRLLPCTWSHGALARAGSLCSGVSMNRKMGLSLPRLPTLLGFSSSSPPVR
jgi:hypothetical protein